MAERKYAAATPETTSTSSTSRLRLHSQGIAHPAPSTPEAIVTHLGAVQAQDYYGARWSIALRIADATRADVERAIEERRTRRRLPPRPSAMRSFSASL